MISVTYFKYKKEALIQGREFEQLNLGGCKIIKNVSRIPAVSHPEQTSFDIFIKNDNEHEVVVMTLPVNNTIIIYKDE